MVRSGRLSTVIHWFRRDLRISDNTSLHHAYTRGTRLIPCFCWEDAMLRSPDVGPAQVQFLLRSLESLAANLAVLGHRLIVRRGVPHEQLALLARETGATAVFTNKDYEPYSRERDAQVSSALEGQGVTFTSFKDSVVWEEREILTGTGGPYTVFTPYSKSWRLRPRPEPRPRLGPAKQSVSATVVSLPLPSTSAELGHPLGHELFPAGEKAAHQALDAFIERRVFGYAVARDHPADEAGTSRLSPHLRFGTINVRTLLKRLGETRAGASTEAERKGCDIWESELIWREFYTQILANFPHVARGSFRPGYDQLKWSGKDAWFDAWCVGQTGYPIVDAAMRCLNATGWMHNRLRMVVSMFLTKDLLISWQRGERYFMQRLVDGDLAANNGGWQWSAGTGTDAAPYFRIFNPTSQGEKFDAAGAFVRRWVPELAAVPDDGIHEPWTNPLWLSRGKYPAPIVDHKVQRDRCLAMYKAVRATMP